MTDNEMYIWMTEQPEGQLCIVFGKWLESTHTNKWIARALRDLGRKFSNEALLEKMERQWIYVKINNSTHKGYLSRDYQLEHWMLSFRSMNNYVFKAQDVVSIEWDGIRWVIEFNDDPSFGKDN